MDGLILVVPIIGVIYVLDMTRAVLYNIYSELFYIRQVLKDNRK